MEVEYISSFTFCSPCVIQIVGPSMTGKSTIVRKLIEYKDSLFEIRPTKVLYCYGVWDKKFDEMKNINFIKGIPNDLEHINSEYFQDSSNHLLIVFDDLMDEIVKSSEMERLFVRGVHHCNISVIYVSHNLYYQGRFSRTISLNLQYLILLRGNKDTRQLHLLGGRLGLKKEISYAMKDIESAKYSYILIDCHPKNEHYMKVITGIFPGDIKIGYIQ